MKQAKQLTVIKEYTTQKLGQDKTRYGMDHINRIVKMSKRLAINEKVDSFLPIVAVYLHDTIDEKLADSVKVVKQELVDYLKQTDFSDEQAEIIMNVINNISFAHTLDKEEVKLSLIGQIVRDVDWLDAVGAIGITRAIYYGGGRREKIYDPVIKPRHNISWEECRSLANETIINHSDEKPLHLKDMTNTETAKKIASHHQQVMLDFPDELHAEWDAKM